MRILANYGYKNNGDSYSVTFETTGDVPIEKASSTVDDLFKLAKEAIQRQISEKETDPLRIDPSKDVSPESDNSNHSYQKNRGNNGNSKNGENRDSNGKNNEMKMTTNQKKFLYRLLYFNKKMSGEEATAYLKEEFKVRLVNDIPCSQADIFIKKILKEAENRGGGNGSTKLTRNGSYQRLSN
ncbi:hypothetical protein HY745_12775 [Candidatus Desantisbacteria bacterium]|nr:hypothetical protein [Candidatus Desantisbacteria bacterium]